MRIRKLIGQILAMHTRQPPEVIDHDTDQETRYESLPNADNDHVMRKFVDGWKFPPASPVENDRSALKRYELSRT
jgi:hypothetical protein